MIGFLDEHPACVLSSSEVAHVGPEGEALYTTSHAEKNIREALRHAPIGEIVGLPHHGAAVFRADAYRRAGGYRSEFYFAQDLDLWIRLAALGEISIADEVLYEAWLNLDGISSLHRSEQVASARLALAIRDVQTPTQVSGLLHQASAIRPPRAARTRLGEAKALYFMAACLRERNDPRWRGYAARAVRRSPLHIPSWLLFIRSAFA